MYEEQSSQTKKLTNGLLFYFVYAIILTIVQRRYLNMELPSVDEFEKALNSLPDEILNRILDKMEEDMNSTSGNSEFKLLTDVDKL